VLVALVGFQLNHGGSNPLNEGRVSGASATYVTIACVPEFFVRNRELYSGAAVPLIWPSGCARKHQKQSEIRSSPVPCDQAVRAQAHGHALKILRATKKVLAGRSIKFQSSRNLAISDWNDSQHHEFGMPLRPSVRFSFRFEKSIDHDGLKLARSSSA
jgi:hypothetical protein